MAARGSRRSGGRSRGGRSLRAKPPDRRQTLTERAIERRQPAGYVRSDRKEGAVTQRRQITEEHELSVIPPPVVADDLFREVNERILELGERFGFRGEPLALICECEDGCCTERISISAAEFAELRATTGLHLVAEGHARSGRVIRRNGGYLVVGD